LKFGNENHKSTIASYEFYKINLLKNTPDKKVKILSGVLLI